MVNVQTERGVVSHDRRHNRVLVKKMAASVLVFTPIATGALVGAELGIRSENNANNHDVHLAKGYERCISFMQALGTGKVTLHASEIPRPVQAACRIETMIDVVSGAAKTGLENATQDAHLGSKIAVEVNPSVTLPSVTDLETARHNTLTASETNGITYPIVEGVLGGLTGMIVVGGTIAANELLRKHEATQV